MDDAKPDIRAIFCEALDRQSPEELRQYLDTACGDNADLRAQVEELLASHRGAGNFLGGASAKTGETIDHPLAEKPGMVIGPYKLRQVIGEGGMGTVYMAEQTEPVQRKVAIKVIKAGLDTQQVIARFEAERQALAMMDHVNIARVLDVGTTRSGRPFFVMELVHGVPITKYCDDNHLTPRQRLELFVPVCQAIQHAHQKGIIHRDIKPSNVMITLYDGQPVPKVIDFGVAKATEQKLTERTLFTQYGTMVGTLEYMSPEQAEMSALGVDTRSDIFSLGVLLYELLTGSTPLSHKRLKEAAFGEVLRMIREEEPPKPSTRLSDSGEALASISAQRHMEPAKLTKLVRGELDWIVMKCLDKDRNRRYETTNGVALDVQRYLKDEPVEACPPSALYRFRKFARRHKRGLLTASVVACAVLLTAASSGGFIWRANQGLHQALDRERGGAYFQRVALAEREWGANNLSRMEELLGQCPEDLRDWEWRYLRRLLHGQPPLLLRHDATVLGVAVSPDGRQIAAGSQDGFITLWDAANGQRLHAFRGHENNVRRVTFSPNGRRLASGSGDGTAKVWDLGSLPGRDRASAPTVIQTAAGGVAFSPDGRRLATAEIEEGGGRAKPGRVKVWDAATGKELLSLAGLEQGASSVAFSADGRYLAAGGIREAVKLWDAQTGQELHTFSGLRATNQRVSFSPDGGLLASGGWRDGQRVYEGVKVWDTRTGQKRFSLLGHVNGIFDVMFSHDGHRLVTAGFDETVKVWDAATGLEVLTLRGHQCSVQGVAFSPDDSLIVSAGFDHTVRIWDGQPLRQGEPGQEYRTLAGHQNQEGITGLAFHPDGRRLAARDVDGTVKLWDWQTGKELHTLHTTERGTGLALSPDGKWLATAGPDLNIVEGKADAEGGPRSERIIKLWAVDPSHTGGLKLPEHTLRGHTKVLMSVAFSSDGRYLASSTASGKPEVGIWDLETLQPLHRQPLLGSHNWPIYGIALNGEDGLLASASLDGTVRIWDVRAGKELVGPPLKHTGPVWCVAFSPDGRLLASGGGDRVVKVWVKVDGKTWKLGHTLHDPGAVFSVAFSPDGRRLAWGGTDSAVKISDFPDEPGADDKDAFHTLRGHRSWVRGVAFSPDGQYLASGSQDGTVRIWKTPNSQQLVELAADPSH